MYVGHFLKRNSLLYGNKTALKSGGTSLTWAELRNRTERLGRVLYGLGLNKGDRVSFLGYNSIPFIEFHLALPSCGLVAVALNFRMVARELETVLDNAECSALIYSSAFASKIDTIRDKLTYIKHFICLEGLRGNDLGYEDLLKSGQQREISPPASEDNPACILYTSGTTGVPKGATMTHRNVLSSVKGIIIEQGIIPENSFLLAAPLFHIAPLEGMLAFLYQACTCVVLSQFDPVLVMETIQRERISHVFLVPRMISAIYEYPQSANYDLSCLSMIIYGGAPISPEHLRKFIKRWGLKFFQHYGATESGLMTCMKRHEHQVSDEGPDAKRLRSCGRQVIDMEVEIKGEDGERLATGEIGEVVVKADSVIPGYWRMSEETRERIDNNGWYRTGDMGYLDEEGYLYLVDRKKYLIISGGENIYPAEVENVLHMMPQILEAAVIGVKDEKWGETVKAVVVLKEGQSLTEEEVIEFCKLHLASYKKPTSVDFIPALPRNAAGKVVKDVLKEKYAKKA